MKRTTYQAVQFGVADITMDGEPGKLLEFYNPDSKEYLDFPMSNKDAEHIASLLVSKMSKVVVPTPGEVAEVNKRGRSETHPSDSK